MMTVYLTVHFLHILNFFPLVVGKPRQSTATAHLTMKTSQLLLCAALVSGASALAPLRATSLDARVKTSGKETALNMRGLFRLCVVDTAVSLFNM